MVDNDYVKISKKSLFNYLEDNYYDYENLSVLKIIPEEELISFLESYKDQLNWKELSEYRLFSLAIYRKFINYFQWKRIPCSSYSKLSVKIVKEILNVLKTVEDKEIFLNNYITNRKVSEKFLKEFLKYLDWNKIVYYQKISEDFIENVLNCRVNWAYVAWRQNLSEEFFIRHIEKIEIGCLEDNKKLPEEVKQRIINLKKVIDQ